MRIAGAALNLTPLDWQGNKQLILDAISQAKSQSISILNLPELTITGYGCEDMFLSPWLSEKATSILLELLPFTQDIAVVVGLPMWNNNKLYNTACLIDNGEILGFQCKQNLPKDGVHYEPRWFTPWPPGSQSSIVINNQEYRFGDYTYSISGVKVGFEICEDAWSEKRPGFELEQQGVELIINPSASHFAMGKSKLRESLMIGGSSRFNCTYLFTNVLGNEGGRIIYDGDVIIAQNGQLLANAKRLSFSPVELCYADVDFSEPINSVVGKIHQHPDDNEQFAQATALGLFDYMRKSSSKGFVLSLSGGADSATCAVLVAEMVRRATEELGVDQFNKIAGLSIDNGISEVLTCAYQRTKNSSETTESAARTLAESIRALFSSWSVDDQIEQAQATIEQALGRQLTWETDDLALQNIQARSRSPLIWFLTNVKGALLLTTSNRSEGSVGYATMDGDTSGSLAPIAGVNKHFIRQWLKWAERELGYSGLRKVNEQQPTAELRPPGEHQTDEEDLMPYDVLAQIEVWFVRDKHTPKEIWTKLCGDLDNKVAALYVTRFFTLWSRNQWKRERLAPSFQLDDYNIDPRSWFRFPILSGSFKDELADLQALL